MNGASGSAASSTVAGTTMAPDTARWLALGAVAGPILFTLAWIVLGLVSPGYTLWDLRVEPYSAISQPISGLGLGPTAPLMNAAFVLMGLLSIAGAVGIFQGIQELSRRKRWTCAGLLALHGVGAIMAGIFTLESIMLHFAGFVLALTPIATFLFIGRALRRVPRWRRLGSWLLLGSPLTLALAILHFATFSPEAAGAGHGIGGLTQRILLVQLQAWLVAMGWLAFRGSPHTGRAAVEPLNSSAR
ncbi:MAG: DUF998 domain-containing protein [Actinomycetota bacterium]|nr:DUF998 domain-containing protein [Actinomycetota bacterium]